MQDNADTAAPEQEPWCDRCALAHVKWGPECCEDEPDYDSIGDDEDPDYPPTDPQQNDGSVE